MSCENIPSIADLEKTKLHADDFGRLMGTGTGTSTNGVTGQVRPTYNKVIADLGFKPGSGDFTTGFTVMPGERDIAWYDPVSKNWYSYLGTIPSSGHVVSPATNPVGDVNWKPVTDQLLRDELSGAGGASMVGAVGGGTVQTEIDDLKTSATSDNNRLDFIEGSAIFNASAPSLPTIGSKKKALFKSTAVTDCLTWVVSRKAQNKQGWVAVAIANEVSPADSSNYGGASNYRPTYVVNGSAFNIAKTTFSAKTAGTVLSSLQPAQVNTIWGYVPDGQDYFAIIGTPPTSWAARQCYDCAGVGDSITYQVTGDCTIRLGMTNASSTAVKIQFSMDGTNFTDYQTLSLKHAPAGTIAKRDVQVRLGIEQPYYVRIENTIAASCIVAGLNIGALPETGSPDVDSAIFIQKANVGGVPNQYQGGLGANEFAAKELSTGKFFGTYHGGHSDFLQRLRTDGASYQLETPSIPAIVISGGFQLHSYSKLTVQSTVYQYTAETLFGDGAHVTSYSIKLISGSPVICERAYTHMCTTMRDFDWVHLPLTFRKLDDGDMNVGDCQFIQQFRGYDATHINCYFSGVNVKDNSSGGAYISFQPNYNKQYYGPALNSTGTPLYTGQFVTAKEYF